MSTEDKGRIDPNTFNSDELLKLVYREIQQINIKIDARDKVYALDQKNSEKKMTSNEMEIREIKTIIEQKEKSFKQALQLLSVALTVLNLLFGIIVWLVTK